MKYIVTVFVILACAFAAIVGWPWFQSHQAYKGARAYIESQHYEGFTYAELSVFSHLRKVPDNIRIIEGLVHLDISHTKVSDLSALSNMQSLNYINLRETNVKNVSVMATLPALRNVDMGETPVRDLSPLADAENLERLDISGTHTISLEPVTRIQNLNWLNLYVAMSDDGSQVYFDELMTRGNIEIQPGNRFKENYIPR